MDKHNTHHRGAKPATVRSVERALHIIELLGEHKFLGLEEGAEVD